MNKNTFGNYQFDPWVPECVQRQITDFWGIFGRTYEDWLSNAKLDERENCMDGHNGANGFGNPSYGLRVIYTNRDGIQFEGRYIHAWGNIGRLILDNGDYKVVSSVEKWVSCNNGVIVDIINNIERY